MTPDPEEVPAPEDQDALRNKAAERDEFLDRLKRTMAEFQNYKHRVGREKADLRKFTTGEVVRALLPVLDNLERAVGSGGGEESDPTLAGIRITIGEFHRILDSLGVKPVRTEGEKFDPSEMDAVARIETETAEENAVLDVYEKGYRIEDFIIRPARVSVAAAPKKD